MSNPWEWVKITPDGPLISTSVTAEEIDCLGRLAEGRDCLEVGSAFGYSAIMMARHGARSVTAVDFHQPCNSNNMTNSHDIMLVNVETAGVSGIVTIVRQSSQDALPALAAQGRKFGLVFIDADHSYQGAKHDAEWAKQLVAEDGFIACHDYGHPGPNIPVAGIDGVNQALDEVFPEGPDWLTGTLHVTKAPW
jgi:predicted O-methyltransferase YrrM